MAVTIGTTNLKDVKEVAGVWLKVAGDGDYHCYLDCNGVLMGHNPQGMLDGNIPEMWSNPAVSFSDDKIEVQYGDSQGKCVTHDVPVHKFVKLYKKFLQDVVELSE